MFIVCAGERKRGDDGRRNVASGVFPLCETCWSELTPAERLPFYRQVFDKWNSDGYATFDWPVWERSVLRERRDDTPFSHHFDSSGREVLTYTDPIGLAASPCGNDI
jgi:hypothetical protein